MIEINFGLSYESQSDHLPIITLVNKIIEPEDTCVKDISPKQSDTGIIGNVKLHTRQFTGDQNLHLAIYFTDCDLNDSSELKEKITREINIADEFFINKSIIGTPKRNLEDWILKDFSNIKRYFGLPGRTRLPRGDDPKNILLKYIGEMEVRKRRAEVYSEIIKGINLNLLERNFIEFKNFKRDLLSKVREIKADRC